MEKYKKGTKEGVCPFCGEYLEYTEDKPTIDDNNYFATLDTVCPNCGAWGFERFKLVYASTPMWKNETKNESFRKKYKR